MILMAGFDYFAARLKEAKRPPGIRCISIHDDSAAFATPEIQTWRMLLEEYPRVQREVEQTLHELSYLKVSVDPSKDGTDETSQLIPMAGRKDDVQISIEITAKVY